MAASYSYYGDPEKRPTELFAQLIASGNFGLVLLLYYTPYPTFPADNAPDRSGKSFCSGCSKWKAAIEFGVDKTLSRRRSRVIYRRYCRDCVAARQALYRKRARSIWRRG